MSDNCENSPTGRQCTKRLSFQGNDPQYPNLYRSDDDDDDDDDEEEDELTDEDFFLVAAPPCDACHSCHLIDDLENELEEETRELVDEDFYDMPAVDEDYSAYPPNMNSRYGYAPQYGQMKCLTCQPSFSQVNGNMPGAGPENYVCSCMSPVKKPCIKDPPCDYNRGSPDRSNKIASQTSCDENTCGDKGKSIETNPVVSPKPQEQTKQPTEPPKTTVPTSKEDIDMFSAVISTVMLLAADVTDIPANYKTSSVKYLQCIRDTKGQYPMNVKKILKMLGVTDEGETTNS